MKCISITYFNYYTTLSSGLGNSYAGTKLRNQFSSASVNSTHNHWNCL